MKITEGKHNHNITKLLKGCLFGLIMILPFLAMLPTTMYFAFNEHAQNYTYQSVTETYEYETNEVNSNNDLVNGNIYHFNFNGLLNNQSIIEFGNTYIYNFKTNSSSYSYWNPSTQVGHIRLTDTRLYLIYEMKNYGLNNGITDYVNLTTFTMNYDFIFDNTYQLSENAYLYISASDYLGEKSVTITESEQSPMTAFNTVSTVIWQSPVFNWVNSGLGSIAIANMLTIFGIARNTFISNILIYWLSITVIYVVIDIVITGFTLLTHIFSKKAE